MSILVWYLDVVEGILMKSVRYGSVVLLLIIFTRLIIYLLVSELQVSGARIKISDKGDFMFGTSDR